MASTASVLLTSTVSKSSQATEIIQIRRDRPMAALALDGALTGARGEDR